MSTESSKNWRDHPALVEAQRRLAKSEGALPGLIEAARQAKVNLDTARAKDERADLDTLISKAGLGDTIRPRLGVLGADVERVHARDVPLTFDADGILRLRECIAAVSPALVIIDPIVAYLGSGVDLHRANGVRAVMSGLAAVASQTRCAIVLVRHLTKGAMTKTIYRGIGSIDMLAASRSVLLVGADAADRDRPAVVHVKSNLAPMGDSLGYALMDGCAEINTAFPMKGRRVVLDEHREAEHPAHFRRAEGLLRRMRAMESAALAHSVRIPPPKPRVKSPVREIDY